MQQDLHAVKPASKPIEFKLGFDLSRIGRARWKNAVFAYHYGAGPATMYNLLYGDPMAQGKKGTGPHARAVKAPKTAPSTTAEALQQHAFAQASMRRARLEADIHSIAVGQERLSNILRDFIIRFSPIPHAQGQHPDHDFQQSAPALAAMYDKLRQNVPVGGNTAPAPTTAPSVVDHEKLHLAVEEAVTNYNKKREAHVLALANFEQTKPTWAEAKAVRDGLTLATHNLIESHRALASICANV